MNQSLVLNARHGKDTGMSVDLGLPAGGARRGRVQVDGATFIRGGRPFRFRGVTYGTFRPGSDGEPYPDPQQVKQDFATISDNGFSVVRTYTVPPDHVLAAAAACELQLLVGVFWQDWRYMVGSSRRQCRTVERAARRETRRAAERLIGLGQVLGLCLGNEVPADVIRWLGIRAVSSTITGLARTVRDIDADVLVTYGNYPTSEYLELQELDFVTFNVFLEHQADLRRYLTRLHHLAAGRPVVVGELGASTSADAGGELAQADELDWQLETTIERGVAGTCVFSWTDDWWVGGQRVEGWRFGLTRADRSPRPALDVARRWNRRGVADLEAAWPPVSVVICAHNAQATIDQCLRHVCALEYPRLEILVVDDGSEDDTASIARRHPRAKLLSIPHGGLSTARNEGLRAATGDIVAYLDSDAYPSRTWAHYLVLGLEEGRLGGVGGPNLPPAGDAPTAHCVSRAPGGPSHVLLADDRAEHVPGCNMAFRRDVLSEVGGFDPAFVTAGDDVDVCWRIVEHGWDIGFHPGAFVWHHPRATTASYLRQQLGYGRSEALLASRHPDRFARTGSALWRGNIYGPSRRFSPRFTRQRVYRGAFGAASYQSVYRAGGYLFDVVHQVGVPLILVSLVSAPLALMSWYLGIPAVVGLGILAALFALDILRCDAPPPRFSGRRFRAHVAMLHLLQPAVRTYGRLRGHFASSTPRPLPGAMQERLWVAGRTTVLCREDRPRPDIVAGILEMLRRSHLRVSMANGWHDYDAHVAASWLVQGRVVSSSHPPGWVHVRVRLRLRTFVVVPLVLAATAFSVGEPVVGAVMASAAAIDGTVGVRRIRSALRRMATRAAT